MKKCREFSFFDSIHCPWIDRGFRSVSLSMSVWPLFRPNQRMKWKTHRPYHQEIIFEFSYSSFFFYFFFIIEIKLFFKKKYISDNSTWKWFHSSDHFYCMVYSLDSLLLFFGKMQCASMKSNQAHFICGPCYYH